MSHAPPPPPPPPDMPSSGAGQPPGGSEPPLAELGPRVVAFLVDWFGPVAAYWVLALILGFVSDALAGIWVVFGSLALLGFAIWNMVQEGSTGQSVGKKMQNIRLVGLENGGQPIGAGMAIARALINNVVCNLGWLLPFFDSQRQTLGDKVTKSIVVSG